MTDRPKRRLRTRLLSAVLAPLVFLLLAEGGLRLFGYSYDPTEELAGQAERKELTQPEMYRPHPRWLWTLTPGATINAPPAGMVEVVTNSEGLRRPEFPEEKRADEFRVLCLGDSVTFGLGLRESETYPARLQKELQRWAADGMRVRVINAGVPGWSSLSGRRFLEDHPDLDPDVIVFWFGLNDAKRCLGAPDARVRPGGGGEALAGIRALRTVQLLSRLLGRIRRSLGSGTRVSPEEYRAATERVTAAAPHAVFVRYPERMELAIGQLEQVLARAAEAGVERVVGPTELLSPFTAAPTGADMRGTRVATVDGPVLRFSGSGHTVDLPVSQVESDLERLRELSARLGELLALLPEGGPGYREMFGYAPPESVFYDNCHMNRGGARRAGSALAALIRPWLEEKSSSR